MMEYGETRFAFDPRHLVANPALEDDISFIDPLERRAKCAEGMRPMTDEAEGAGSREFYEV